MQEKSTKVLKNKKGGTCPTKYQNMAQNYSS